MIGFGRHPRNQFFGHRVVQASGRARFLDLLMGGLRPAGVAQYGGPTSATREYGSTDPIQRFPVSARVNRTDSIEATAPYQVPASGNTKTRRPDPRTPTKVGA